MPVYSDYLRDDDPEYPAPAPNTPPITPGGGVPVPGGGGGGVQTPDPVTGGGGGGGGMVRPVFPGVNIPGAPKFQFDPYVAPDKNALLSDPGYLARVQQGQQGLERSAAAKGLLRTGGTLQGISDYNQASASQEYGNAVQRALQAYDRYYQGRKDAYAPEFARWQQQADANKQGGLMGYQADLSHFLQSSAPHYEPEPDWNAILGPDIAPPVYGGGDAGYAPTGYTANGYPWGDEETKRRLY